MSMKSENVPGERNSNNRIQYCSVALRAFPACCMWLVALVKGCRFGVRLRNTFKQVRDCLIQLSS